MRWAARLSFISLYTSKFAFLGVQLPFLSGWLALRGFSAFEIGLVTGAALGARLMFGPVVAWWADGRQDARIALRAVAGLFALSAVALAFAPGKFAIAASAITVLWAFGVLGPLVDSAALRADRQGLLHFGQTRAIGSFAFLAANLLVGEALTRVGLDAAVAIMAAAGAATFACALALPRVGEAAPQAPPKWREAARLLRERPFLIALLAAGLTQAAHAVYYAFSILHWTSLGYTPRVIGALWATGVFAEILFLIRARGFVRRLSPPILIAIGAAGAAVRWLLTAFEPPLAWLFAVQTLHALTFAATFIGVVEFIDRAAPKRFSNTALTLNATFGVGALTGIATIGAGALFERHGADAAYFAMAAMAALSAGLALYLARIWQGQKLFD